MEPLPPLPPSTPLHAILLVATFYRLEQHCRCVNNNGNAIAITWTWVLWRPVRPSALILTEQLSFSILIPTLGLQMVISQTVYRCYFHYSRHRKVKWLCLSLTSDTIVLCNSPLTRVSHKILCIFSLAWWCRMDKEMYPHLQTTVKALWSRSHSSKGSYCTAKGLKWIGIYVPRENADFKTIPLVSFSLVIERTMHTMSPAWNGTVWYYKLQMFQSSLGNVFLVISI